MTATFAYTDTNLHTIAFNDGVISTVGAVTLGKDAALDLVSSLLQHVTQTWPGEAHDPQ